MHVIRLRNYYQKKCRGVAQLGSAFASGVTSLTLFSQATTLFDSTLNLLYFLPVSFSIYRRFTRFLWETCGTFILKSYEFCNRLVLCAPENSHNAHPDLFRYPIKQLDQLCATFAHTVKKSCKSFGLSLTVRTHINKNSLLDGT